MVAKVRLLMIWEPIDEHLTSERERVLYLYTATSKQVLRHGG